MADFVGIIPARGGSKGVPDKNIKLLAGEPLIAYSIAAAKRSKGITRVIVSTDSEQYAAIAQKYGAEVPFLRPVELAQDHSTNFDFIEHLLEWMQVNEGKVPEYLVQLLPTTPLRDSKVIDDAIALIKGNNTATALRSVHEMAETAYKTLEIEDGFLKCVCTGSFEIDNANLPRQLFPETYQPNGYVDIMKTDFVMKNKKLHGSKVLSFLTPKAVEVDSLEEFEYLEYLVARDQSIVKRLFPTKENL